MDVHPTKNGINRYWSIPISMICLKYIAWQDPSFSIYFWDENPGTTTGIFGFTKVTGFCAILRARDAHFRNRLSVFTGQTHGCLIGVGVICLGGGRTWITQIGSYWHVVVGNLESKTGEISTKSTVYSAIFRIFVRAQFDPLLCSSCFSQSQKDRTANCHCFSRSCRS